MSHLATGHPADNASELQLVEVVEINVCLGLSRDFYRPQIYIPTAKLCAEVAVDCLATLGYEVVFLSKSFKSKTDCTPRPAANSNQTAAGLTEAETTKQAQMNSDKAQPIAEFQTQLVTAAQEKRISYSATTGLKDTTNSIPTTYYQLTASAIM